jgi:hypothetical protein
MAEQGLDDADVDAVLDQVGGEAVPQRVRADVLGQLRRDRRRLDHAAELAGGDGPGRVLAGEQPPARPHDALSPALLPPGPEQGEQARREQSVAAPASLAALDDDQHAPAVDVAHLERRHLGHAQAGTIGHRERGPVLEAGRGRDQARGLVGAEHDRELARVAEPDQLAGQIRPVERVVEEEAQGRHGAVHGRCIHALLGLPDLEPADVLGRRRAGRALQEGGKAFDSAEVVLAGLIGEPAHGHVGDEALAQATGGCRREMGHGELLGMGELPASARAWTRSIYACLPTRQRVRANRTNPAIAGSFSDQLCPSAERPYQPSGV